MNAPNEVDMPEMEELTAVDVKSFADIYGDIYISGEIILVIDSQDLGRLKNGLSVAKANHVKKLKDSGIEEQKKVLEYIPHEKREDDGLPEGQIKVSVILKSARSGIIVHKTIVPQGE